jgi:pyruvate,water dikinase
LISIHSTEATLDIVGGKGVNLVKLANAGFSVPSGFLIPIVAYREYIRQNHIMPRIKGTLQETDFTSPADLARASKLIRTQFTQGSFSPNFTTALEEGWRWLGACPVAVRSSATTEDFPDLSFAGQQDTFLNVIGQQALHQAVVDCWSSLWTARAIGYRARHNIPHEDVALSVVVQQMIQSEASGVLFTANPINGRRHETVIDATLGLGEALVSGQVEPDHYAVDTTMHAITHKFLGSKSIQITARPEGGVITEEQDSSQKQAIPDQIILQLAHIGNQIEALYQFPQDIEWAYRPSTPERDTQYAPDDVYILQSRPITSLYPLPENLHAKPLKTLIGLHVIQGVMEPYTPLGQTAIMEVLTGGGRAFGLNLSLNEQTAFYVAGERIWINVTPIVRHQRGHKAYPTVIKNIDPGVAQIFKEILDDPRLAPKSGIMSLQTFKRIAQFVFPNLIRVLRCLRQPEKRAQQVLDELDAVVAETAIRQQSIGELGIDFKRRVELLLEARNIFPDFVIPKAIPPVVAGMVPFFGILQRFSRETAVHTGEPKFENLYLEVARGLPNNVTTEMDLLLWQTAQEIREDAESFQIFDMASAETLAAQYKTGDLPSTAQEVIASFMERYEMRGLGEIDIGRPRWGENPEHIMGVLQSYLQIDDPNQAPDVVFAKGDEAATAAAKKLEDAVLQLPGGWIKGRLVRFGVRRYRALAGLREAPKFFAIRMMGVIRKGLLSSGEDMVDVKLLDQVDDLFYLHVAELERLAADLQDWKTGNPPPASLTDLRPTIEERRSIRVREMRRKQIPRVLLSDGTAYYEGVQTVDVKEGLLVGDPVSPGLVEGTVRVVFNPKETPLEPGEILVCPGTDPAWTPLFLTAGGLVMEVGGMMTHGSVVAREYGIPAVVGVHQATEKLQTGDRVRIDGSSGQIQIL